MKLNIRKKIVLPFILCSVLVSCVEKKDLSRPIDPEGPIGPEFVYKSYLYPFDKEVQNAVAEITIQANKEINANNIGLEIPYLKYNKSWLLMLTQDDCVQSTFCRTWAAINGHPVSSSEKYPSPDMRELYYDAPHLQANDLPPSVISASGTLGSSDGNGNEVRFAITTTLLPEAKWMNAAVNVNKDFVENYSRFYRKTGLVWNSVIEMLNYGTGIAFHNVAADNEASTSDILKHYGIAQDSINKRLSGRGCKMLAEPNGLKAYVTAAQQFPDIQTMVAQTGTERLYPFKVTDDLRGVLLHRTINETPSSFKAPIETQLQNDKTEREAIHIGVHNTDNQWVEFLRWVNKTYGKDGDDSVWFPSQEEYYEYNYYRIHGTISVEQVDKNTVKIRVELPSEKYFYYPATTLNVTGIAKEDIATLSSNDAVTGLSYGNYEDGISVNIDCRKYLYEHAKHYVEYYEKDKSNSSRKADARYFVSMLKDSSKKTELLNRIK